MARAGNRDAAAALIARIDARLLDLGKTRYWLSKAITDGKDHRAVAQIAERGTMPGGDRLRRIAEEIETTVDWLLGTVDSPVQPVSEVAFRDDRLPYRGQDRDVSLPLAGTGDCAELEVCDVAGHKVEVERSSFDPDYTVRMVVRPPALAGVREAYAIEYRGDSMSPRYEAGDYGVVDPRRAYGAGDYVVVQLREGESDTVGSVIVKRLVRATTRELVLEQFNPPLVFTIPRSQVLRVHRILRDVEYWTT